MMDGYSGIAARGLFGAEYSPRRIRFYLLHWDVLESLGEWPRNARSAFTLLGHEWKMMQEDGKRGFDCLCVALNDGLPTMEEQGSSGAAHGIPVGVDLRADLLAAADQLPITWRATAEAFRLQNRRDVWAARLATHRLLGLPRPQDRRAEPPFDPLHGEVPGQWRCENPFRCGSGALAVGMMALYLGWRPKEKAA